MNYSETTCRQLQDELQQHHQFMEKLTTALVTDYRARGGEIYCGKGCSNCCSLVVNCTFPEAQLLANRLDEELLQAVDCYVERLRRLASGVTELKDYLRRHRRDSGGCPLLGPDGACRAYELRPLSCRALLATKESRWCGADFAELTAAEKGEFVASLDQAVTAFPLHYLAATQDAGRELEKQELLSMAREHGFSLYGNMAVLVHMASRWGMAEAFATGAETVRELLHLAELDHPLLVDLEEL
jgi:Fe-S-cluster containining protein